jgi:hypothetical protein
MHKLNLQSFRTTYGLAVLWMLRDFIVELLCTFATEQLLLLEVLPPCLHFSNYASRVVAFRLYVVFGYRNIADV